MSALSFKCPNCGGELLFDPSQQQYKCEYCDSTFSQQQLDELSPIHGQEYTEASDDAEPSGADTVSGDESSETGEKPEGEGEGQGTAENQENGHNAVVYSCPSCGAEIVTDETTAATFCFYCHNPVVLEGRVTGEYLPDWVIPFKIDRKEAEKKFRSYIKGKRYVPKAFYEDSQIEKLSGVYYPYWVYECSIDGQLSAEGTKLQVWRTGETEYTRTSIYDVERAGRIEIHNLLRNALKKTNRELVENVQPFRMKDVSPFKMGYLSGFLAEKRDMEQDAFRDELQGETKGYAQKMLKNTAGGYSVLKERASNYHIGRENWYYTLLPVWVLTYKSLGDKIFYFAMNGQTGTVCGKLPIDKGKLALHSIAIGAVVAVLCLIGGFLI